LHCTCQAVHVSSWSGQSTSAGGQACRSALYGGGWDLRGHTQYRESVETRWTLTEHGATRIWHWLPWYWHFWAFDIGCYPTGSVARQEGHNAQILSLGSPTKTQTCRSR
jgi:hypothetical protein